MIFGVTQKWPEYLSKVSLNFIVNQAEDVLACTWIVAIISRLSYLVRRVFESKLFFKNSSNYMEIGENKVFFFTQWFEYALMINWSIRYIQNQLKHIKRSDSNIDKRGKIISP